MKIGIFSGTFDPVHNGHIGFARAAAERAQLDKVVFLPEALPRRKKNCTPLPERVEMLEIATVNDDALQVFTSQTPEHLPSETMLEIYAEYGNDNDYYLLMGADVFEHIETWPGHEKLLGENSVILALRTEDDGEQAMDIASRLNVEPVMIASRAPNLSSSKIRNRLSKGEPVQSVDEGVLEYIESYKLYE